MRLFSVFLMRMSKGNRPDGGREESLIRAFKRRLNALSGEFTLAAEKSHDAVKIGFREFDGIIVSHIGL